MSANPARNRLPTGPKASGGQLWKRYSTVIDVMPKISVWPWKNFREYYDDALGFITGSFKRGYDRQFFIADEENHAVVMGGNLACLVNLCFAYYSLDIAFSTVPNVLEFSWCKACGYICGFHFGLGWGLGAVCFGQSISMIGISLPCLCIGLATALAP